MIEAEKSEPFLPSSPGTGAQPVPRIHEQIKPGNNKMRVCD